MRRAWPVLALVGLLGLIRYGSLGEPEAVPDRASAEWKMRVRALERARVFLPRAQKSTTSAGADFLRCTFVPKAISGTTPKFDCRLDDGEVVKVKYGANPEVPAEIGASRLLAALGLGADHVWRVKRLDCIGCPPHPYRLRQLAEMLFLAGPFERMLNFEQSRSFDHVAIERKFEAAPIKAADAAGWQWSELEEVKASAGGASRAELDAFRLVAVALAHWDNKPSNQRLVCLDEKRAHHEDGAAGKDDDLEDDTPCRHPLLMLQDVGATFGPRKLNHGRWTATPMWESGEGCVATMSSLPYNGSTFRPVRISEEGRQLFVAKMRGLSDQQLHDIFRGAGFPDPETGEPRADDVTPWVESLRRKIAEVAARGPCPAV